MANNLWMAPPEVAVMRHGNDVILCHWHNASQQDVLMNWA
jgi:hypothetical protein